MNLLVISHKEVWRDGSSPSGFSTVGGFPQQIRTLAALFEQTTLMVFERQSPAPGQLTPIRGPHLVVEALLEPRPRGPWRKVALLARAPALAARIWRALGRADAVHALVPGDLGFLGLLLALMRRKPLLVRHCGTWGHRATLADRLLAELLPRIATGNRWVLATGGGDTPPVPGGNASWIFSTSLSNAEIEEIAPARTWRTGQPLALITVGRLTRGKNAAAVIEALPEIRRQVDARLTVVGDGPERRSLVRLATRLGLSETVHFTGNQSHAGVLEHLSRSHLLILPTRVAEGFPKAVLEALACGVPVVATSVSVVPQLLRAGTSSACGWTLDGTDSSAVARAVATIVSDGDAFAAAAAAATVRAQSFTLERWQEELSACLSRVWPSYAPPTSDHPEAPESAA